MTKHNAFSIFSLARKFRFVYDCKFLLATTGFRGEVTEFVTKTTICDMGIDKNSRLC